MLDMISAARYPTPARSEPQEPMVVIARAVIKAIPLHYRTASTASSSSTASPSSSSSTSSTFESEEKAPLLPASVKKASQAIKEYGSMLKHHRTHSRHAELKRSISRPINHDGEWFCNGVEKRQVDQAIKEEAEMERSIGSVYSSQTWASGIEEELSRIRGAFEFDDARATMRDSTMSIQTFTSSERSYTFF